MNNSYSIYNELIENIPDDLKVDECIIGFHWTFVRSGDHAGIAMTFSGGNISGFENGPYTGRTLKETAALAKSWNMIEASVGMAAVNCFYNTKENMEKYGFGDAAPHRTGAGESIFNEPLEAIKGKKVAVIGHFPYVEKQLGSLCQLSVLERDPDHSDLLDSACEYILPEQDYVFITGMTFTNKTIPRLLALTKDTRTILVGPSSPMTPLLFKYGIDTVAGFYVTDVDMVRTLASQAAHTEIFRGGRRITFAKETVFG